MLRQKRVKGGRINIQGFTGFLSWISWRKVFPSDFSFYFCLLRQIRMWLIILNPCFHIFFSYLINFKKSIDFSGVTLNICNNLGQRNLISICNFLVLINRTMILSLFCFINLVFHRLLVTHGLFKLESFLIEFNDFL